MCTVLVLDYLIHVYAQYVCEQIDLSGCAVRVSARVTSKQRSANFELCNKASFESLECQY